MESIAYEKCVTLETALPEVCSLRGNPDYLQRIVSSLLENALKYEPAGGRVQLTLTQDKRRVQLSVQNFGSAIPAEDLPHVFDRFYRSDKSRKNESGSFGLGLAITKEMVEKELSRKRKLLCYAAGWLDGQCSALVGQAFVHS